MNLRDDLSDKPGKSLNDDLELDDSWSSKTGRIVSAYWWIIAAGAGLCCFVAIVAVAAIFLLLPEEPESPEVAACAFYEEIANEDFIAASEYVDPSSKATIFILEGAESVSDLVEEGILSLLLPDLMSGLVTEVLPGFGLELDLPIPTFDWQLSNLRCEVLNVDGDMGRVQVTTDVAIFLDELQLLEPEPYMMEHDMILVDGRWYIRFD